MDRHLSGAAPRLRPVNEVPGSAEGKRARSPARPSGRRQSRTIALTRRSPSHHIARLCS